MYTRERKDNGQSNEQERKGKWWRKQRLWKRNEQEKGKLIERGMTREKRRTVGKGEKKKDKL